MEEYVRPLFKRCQSYSQRFCLHGLLASQRLHFLILHWELEFQCIDLKDTNIQSTVQFIQMSKKRSRHHFHIMHSSPFFPLRAVFISFLISDKMADQTNFRKWTIYFSSSCDKIPDKSNFRRGSLWLTVQGYSPSHHALTFQSVQCGP